MQLHLFPYAALITGKAVKAILFLHSKQTIPASVVIGIWVALGQVHFPLLALNLVSPRHLHLFVPSYSPSAKFASSQATHFGLAPGIST